MKRPILTLAGSLLLSITIAQAQQDTTQTKQSGINAPRPANTQQPQYPQPQYPQTQPQQNQTQPNQPATQSQGQYRRDDMVVVPQDQLPESLRETLRGTEYQGWEQSTIYQDPATGEYLLDMGATTTGSTPNNTNPSVNQDRTGNNTPRTYRFDRYGRVVKDKNKTGVDNNDQ